MKINGDNVDFDPGDFKDLSADALAGLKKLADRTNITIEQYLSGRLTDVVNEALALNAQAKGKSLSDAFAAADTTTQAAIIDAVSKVPGVSVKPADVADVAPVLKQ